ncbi:MAG: hypothetical protein AB7F76_02870 [Parvibaculaceae bacterium]
MRAISTLLFALACFSAGKAWAFDPPAFPLNDAQFKALEEYAGAKSQKAFAAGPDGQFSAQAGFVSATIAAREALKACDEGVSNKTHRCVIIDINGEPVSQALQIVQMMRLDPELAGKPVALHDLKFDLDTWRAMQGYEEKAEHKAFALSLRGPWGRSWEAGTIEEAEKEALAACDRNEPAAKAPCFIVARDGTPVPVDSLRANPDLSVSVTKPK